MGKKREDEPLNKNTQATSDKRYEETRVPASSLQQALDYGYTSVQERSLTDYLNILFRNWLVIVTLTIVGFGLAFHHNHTAPRIFRSTALVNIGTYVPPVEGPTGDSLREETRRTNYISTQARLLKSYTIAERVLKTFPNIRAKLDPEFSAAPDNQNVAPSVLQAYLGKVTFQPIDGTTLVKVSAATTNSDFSADIANAHVKVFIGLVQEQRKESANINLEFLKSKLEEATQKVKTAEEKRIAYVEEHNLNIIGTELTDEIFTQKYQGLTNSLNKAIYEKNAAEAAYLASKSSGGSGGSVARDEFNLARLESELKQTQQRLKDRFHPEVIGLENQIKATKYAMKASAKQRIKQARERYFASEAQENKLRSEFKKLNSEQIDKSKHKVAHDALQQEVQSTREVQKSIAKRLEEAMINAESTQETVVLVDKAYASAYPVSPNVRSNLWKGCLLGLIAGLLVALLLDFIDNKVHSVHDLQQALSVPVLGVVPQFSKEVLKLSSTYMERHAQHNSDHSAAAEMTFSHVNPVPLVSAPFSAESESVRSILATLTAHDGTANPRSLLITSGQKSDGKTTISLNLATALAQVGERTLLIDADLRLPSVHKYFDLSRHTPGLLECLTENKDPGEVILQSSVEHLDLLMPGGPCTNPASLLKSNAMGELIDMLSEEYDYIIIDSPPIGPVADSLILARHVDGAAVVIRSGETSRSLAESAVVRLRQVGTHIFGVVLNDASKGETYWRSGYHRTYSSSYNSAYNKQIES